VLVRAGGDGGGAPRGDTAPVPPWGFGLGAGDPNGGPGADAPPPALVADADTDAQRLAKGLLVFATVSTIILTNAFADSGGVQAWKPDQRVLSPIESFGPTPRTTTTP